MEFSLKLTTVIEEDPDGGYLAYIEELPGVNTQGESIAEAKANLFDALKVSLDFHREQAEEDLKERRPNIAQRDEIELFSL